MPKPSQIKTRLLKIEKQLDKCYGTPDRVKKADPLDILVGTILSQNTNDDNSYKAFLKLKQAYDSWEKVAELTAGKIEKIIKTAGLGKQKSRAIKDLLNYLKKEKGEVTLSHHKLMSDEEIIEEMTAIPGIGLKTTSCLLLFGYGRNVCPVDTHVHRVMNKTGIVKTSSLDKTFKDIAQYVPDKRAYHLHTNLLKLGREFCRPTNPACNLCPIKKLCDYGMKHNSSGEKRINNRVLLLDTI